jgi:hypothetical protein
MKAVLNQIHLSQLTAQGEADLTQFFVSLLGTKLAIFDDIYVQ